MNKIKKQRKHTHIGVRIATKDRLEAMRKLASITAGFPVKMVDFMDKLSFSSPSS